MEKVKITDFLERGSQIRTQIENSINWIPNFVLGLESDGSKLEIVLDNRYDDFVIYEGNFIKLNYLRGNIQYFIETIVYNLKLGKVKSLVLEVLKINTVPNLRKYQRYQVNYGANVFSFQEPNGVFGVITNISLSGLAITTKSTLYLGQVVNISILFPSAEFCIDAEIVRYRKSAKSIEYGVKFVRQDEEAIREISRIIEEIKEREDSLSRLIVFNI